MPLLKSFLPILETGRLLLWASLLAVLQLIIALYAQHYKGEEPCRLCVLIRADILFIAITSATGYFWRQRKSTKAVLASFAFMGSLVGTLHSFSLMTEERFLGSLEKPGGCTFSSVFPNWLPLDHWLPDVFEPRAICGDAQWNLFGLPASLVTIAFFFTYAFYFSCEILISLRRKN